MHLKAGYLLLALASEAVAGKCVWKSHSPASYQTSTAAYGTDYRPSTRPNEYSNQASGVPLKPSATSRGRWSASSSAVSSAAPSGMNVGSGATPGSASGSPTNLVTNGGFEFLVNEQGSDGWFHKRFRADASWTGQNVGDARCPWQTIPCDEGQRFYLTQANFREENGTATYLMEQQVSGLVVSENDNYEVGFDAIGMANWDPAPSPPPAGMSIQVYYPDRNTIIYTTEVTNAWTPYGFTFFPDVESGTLGFFFNVVGYQPTMGIDAITLYHF